MSMRIIITVDMVALVVVAVVGGDEGDGGAAKVSHFYRYEAPRTYKTFLPLESIWRVLISSNSVGAHSGAPTTLPCFSAYMLRATCI